MTTHIFDEFPILHTDRLILREISTSEVGSIIDISIYDGIFAIDEQHALSMLELINDAYLKGEGIHWGICLREANAVIGTCGFYRGYLNNVGEVGYILRESYRGQGIMTEAVRCVVDFGLNVMDLRRIVAYTEPTNEASMAVLRRVGFHEVSTKEKWVYFREGTTA